MSTLRITVITVVALLCGGYASAQTIDTAAELKKIMVELKALKRVSYDYTKKGVFPNGDKDELKGRLTISKDEHSMLDECDAYITLYNGRWMYNANHRKKTIAIMDMQKDANKQMKQEVETQIFDNTSLDAFADSLILKKATIKTSVADGKGKEKLSLVFAEESPIRSIYVEYDRNTAIVLLYEMVTFQPMQQTDKGVKGVTTRISCSNFSKVVDNAMFRDDVFFKYAQGKLELKKYNTYKLTTKI